MMGPSLPPRHRAWRQGERPGTAGVCGFVLRRFRAATWTEPGAPAPAAPAGLPSRPPPSPTNDGGDPTERRRRLRRERYHARMEAGLGRHKRRPDAAPVEPAPRPPQPTRIRAPAPAPEPEVEEEESKLERSRRMERERYARRRAAGLFRKRPPPKGPRQPKYPVVPVEEEDAEQRRRRIARERYHERKLAGRGRYPSQRWAVSEAAAGTGLDRAAAGERADGRLRPGRTQGPVRGGGGRPAASTRLEAGAAPRGCPAAAAAAAGGRAQETARESDAPLP
uniref:Uncharacterized protein n=1 Tax=Alexandrium monilatum TaxID=311494 RepID=A0A7S4RI81_9DINO